MKKETEFHVDGEIVDGIDDYLYVPIDDTQIFIGSVMYLEWVIADFIENGRIVRQIHLTGRD